MSDHIGLRYSFDQPNMNTRQARWLATISEFNFKIRYIKGKENRVADALSRRVQANHLEAMSSYETDLQDRILHEGQQDVIYMEIMCRLHQDASTGVGTCISAGTCTCSGIGTGSSKGTSTCIGTDAGA